MTLTLNSCLQRQVFQTHEEDSSLILTLMGSVPPPRDTAMGVGLTLQSLQHQVTPRQPAQEQSPPHVETPGADISTQHLGGADLSCFPTWPGPTCAPDPVPWSQSNPLGALASRGLSQQPGPRLWHEFLPDASSDS